MVADLHCHPSLPALNTGKNMWKFNPPTPEERVKMINTTLVNGFNQSDYTSLCKAKARLVFHSFYPVEQSFLASKFPFTEITDKDNFFNKLVKLLVGKVLLAGPREIQVQAVLSKIIYDMTPTRFLEITNHNHDYFSDLENEHALFVQQMNSNEDIDGLKPDIEIIQNYNQLKLLLNIDNNYEIGPITKNIIGVVFTVEGSHSLGCGQFNTIISDNAEEEFKTLNDLTNATTIALQQKLISNIQKLKKLGLNGMNTDGTHAPLFITFTHHFWNQLCGSAMSFAKNANKVFDQTRGLGFGFTELGKKVLAELLSTKNGKRILIDVKHMSIDGRTWLYNFLIEYSKEFNNNIPIPIVASHVGVNGLSNYDANTYPANHIDHNNMDDAYENSKSIYNIWDINLFDEDIIQIFRSRGMIGLNFDQRILSGKLIIDSSTNIAQSITRPLTEDETAEDIDDSANAEYRVTTLLYKSIWAQPIIENYLHIIKTIYNSNEPNKEYAWNMVCIGSDFDGMINALDAYCCAGDFEVLQDLFVQKLNARVVAEPILEEVDVQEIVKGFMYKNLLRFLEKNFV